MPTRKKKTASTRKTATRKAAAPKRASRAAKPKPRARKPAAAPAPAPASPSSKKDRATASGKASVTRSALRNRILGAKNKPTRPIAFSLDEVRAIARTVSAPEDRPEKSGKPAAARSASSRKADLMSRTRTTPNHIKPASLSDILGFNPKRGRSTEVTGAREVPEKFRRYFRILVDLRKHLTEGIELHSEETLKRSAREDAGDLSAYGQHMADAGTDTFDRDFALSLVSSEQEALTEIDAAIKRIHDGTYGICEVTGKPIARERLLAVPFTRYSADAQKEIERNRHRTRTQAGLFGELGDEVAKHDDDSGGGDE